MEISRSHKQQNESGYRYFKREYLENILQLFKRPFWHQVAGDLRLGFVMNSPIIFSLLLSEIQEHVGIFARSGAGKSNLIRIILLELHRLKVPFMAFDLSKYGTRYLKAYIPDLLILRWFKEFTFNPLVPPPAVKLKEWMLAFCEITSEVFGLLAASKSLLIQVVKDAYDKFDSENTGNYPTIIDLQYALDRKRIEAVKKRSYPEIDYVDRVRNKITAICISLGEQLDVEQGIPIEQLLNHYVCIELVGLNISEIQAWLISLIMVWIDSYRRAQMHFGTLRHAILFDDASLIFKGN